MAHNSSENEQETGDEARERDQIADEQRASRSDNPDLEDTGAGDPKLEDLTDEELLERYQKLKNEIETREYSGEEYDLDDEAETLNDEVESRPPSLRRYDAPGEEFYVPFPDLLNDEKFSVRKEQERTRGQLARWLVLLLASSYLLFGAVVVLGRIDADSIKELMTLWWTSLVSLVSGALGFYFGTKTDQDDS